ncbi:MAG TPA: LytR C-terminal domain-containing protein [Acidimicrobiia bacterium]
MTEPSTPGGGDAARRRPALSASSFTRSMLGAFARGTGLVAVALVIGIVLLQWSDASTDAAAGGQPPPAGTPVAPSESSTTTTTAPPGPRPPAQVAVLVLNGTGKNAQAKPMADRLAVVGYHTLTSGTVSKRADTVVLCRPGLDREAAALVAATGLGPAATTGTLDGAVATGLPGAGAADCVVILGAR